MIIAAAACAAVSSFVFLRHCHCHDLAMMPSGRDAIKTKQCCFFREWCSLHADTQIGEIRRSGEAVSPSDRQTWVRYDVISMIDDDYSHSQKRKMRTHTTY